MERNQEKSMNGMAIKRLFIVVVLLAFCASCTVTLLYQNHSDGSSINTESSARADSSQISVTLPSIRSNP
jgi:nitrate/nitrite-specific signal transduction histidine kinase